MGEEHGYRDAWPRDPQTPIVGAFHGAIRKLAEERLGVSGKRWEEVVHDRSLQLTREDFEKIEADLLATGYRFEASATVTYEEAPEKHKPLADLKDSGEQEIDEAGRRIVGSGDNVFSIAKDLEGIARHVHTVDKVMEWLTDTVDKVMEWLTGGVPAGTIAVIDDCGGTLTAPILGEFKAVVCMGGTVRSHLGILTREYNVPCLMNATIDGLRDGSRIAVEYSRPAADAYAEGEKAAAQRSRIFDLGEA